MTTKKLTPQTTKAASDAPPADQDHAKLVDANPAELSKADIQEITKDDGTDAPDNEANADAADALEKAKKDAGKDDGKPTYFHGQGGAVGL